MNDKLRYYSGCVKFPNVSGIEHLDMLFVRDDLEAQIDSLSQAEQEQLAEADRRLITQAAAFHRELLRFTSMEYQRELRKVPPSHWWWYLDVLSYLPQFATKDEMIRV